MISPSLSLSRGLVSLALSLLISLYGLKRKSLSLSGGVAAVLVGFVLTASNGCFFMALLTFFITSSRLTKWKAAEKKKLEQDHKEGGQRDWVQVFCNGSVASVAAVVYVWVGGGYGEVPFILDLSRPLPPSSLAAIACLAAISCCCGDTWASEVGSVKGGMPRLVTSWKEVPRGTNGGVTSVGLLCSFLGGVVVGVAYFAGVWVFLGFESVTDAMCQGAAATAVGGMSGLLGSLLDSLLGATVQYSGLSSELKCVVHGPSGEGWGRVQHISGLNLLGNDAVNFVSSLLTAVAAPMILYCISG